jgi:hypothetical protein
MTEKEASRKETAMSSYTRHTIAIADAAVLTYRRQLTI